MSVRKSLVYSSIGQYGSIAVQFVASVAISRLLLPEEVGVFSVTLAAASLLQVLRDLGVSRYLVQEPNLTESRLRTAFGLTLLTSWTIGAVLLLLREPIAAFFGRPEMVAIVVVLAVNYAIVPFGQPAMSLMMREMQFGRRSIAALSGALLGAAVSIVLAYTGMSSISLAYGSLAGSLLTAAIALYFYPRHVLLRPSLSEWRHISTFGGYVTGTAVISTLGMRAPEIAIGRILGMTDAGLFARAHGLSLSYGQLILGALSPVLAASLSQLRRTGSQSMREPYLHVMSCQTGLGWPFFIALAALAEPIVLFLYGEDWIGVAPILQILCLSSMVMVPAMLVGEIFLSTGRVAIQFWITVLMQVIWISLLIPAAMHSLEAVALSLIPWSCIYTPLHLAIVSRLIGFSLRQFLAAMWRSTAVLLALAIWTVGFMALSDGRWSLSSVALYVLGFSAIYLAVLAAVRHELLAEAGRATGFVRGKIGHRPS